MIPSHELWNKNSEKSELSLFISVDYQLTLEFSYLDCKVNCSMEDYFNF